MKKIIITLLFLFSCNWCYATAYYAASSVQGSGNCSSAANACLINTAWASMSAGDTLWLADGTYTGANSMIKPPNTLDGTSINPITVKATNDGAVTINGEGARIPISIDGADWFIVEGVNAYNSSAQVVFVRGTNITIRRVIAWDGEADSHTSVVFLAYQSTNALFEDCAGWGVGPKIFEILSDDSSVLRRCFLRWTYTNSATFKNGLTHGYWSKTSIVENCIATWDVEPGSNVAQSFAPLGSDSTNEVDGPMYSYGNIGFEVNAQTGNTTAIVGISTAFFSPINLKDVVAYTDTNKSADGFSLDINVTADYCTSITEGSGSNFVSGTINDSLSDPTIGTLGGDICQYTSTSRPASGAWIRNRYVDGVLTEDALWPWPMNDRIAAAFVTSGYDASGIDGNGNTDLTNVVFTLYGGTEPSWEEPPVLATSIGKFTGAGSFR